MIRKDLCWVHHSRMIVFHSWRKVHRSECHPCSRGLKDHRKGCSCCWTRGRKDFWSLKVRMGFCRVKDRKDLWLLRGRKDLWCLMGRMGL